MITIKYKAITASLRILAIGMMFLGTSAFAYGGASRQENQDYGRQESQYQDTQSGRFGTSSDFDRSHDRSGLTDQSRPSGGLLDQDKSIHQGQSHSGFDKDKSNMDRNKGDFNRQSTGSRDNFREDSRAFDRDTEHDTGRLGNTDTSPKRDWEFGRSSPKQDQDKQDKDRGGFFGMFR